MPSPTPTCRTRPTNTGQALLYTGLPLVAVGCALLASSPWIGASVLVAALVMLLASVTVNA